MEPTENKPLADANSEGGNVAPAESTQDVSGGTAPENGGSTPENTVLSKAAEVTKREFKTEDEFLKYLENLNSMTGDQQIIELRKKAETYDALVKEGKIQEEKKEVAPTENDRVSALERQLEEYKFQGDFFKKYPKATQAELDLVRDRARANGVSLQDAEAQLAESLTALVSTREQGQSTLPSNERAVPGNTETQEEWENARKTGDWAQIVMRRSGLGGNAQG